MRTAGICLQSSPRTKLGLERTGVNDRITIEFYALELSTRSMEQEECDPLQEKIHVDRSIMTRPRPSVKP